MAKLYFYYGAMGSSKTANALMANYNYEERGQKTLLAKTNIDTVTPDSLKTVIELLAKEEGLLIHKIRSDKDMG